MQRHPKEGTVPSTSVFADNSNKWATTILSNDGTKKNDGKKNVGFGTNFFQ